MVWTAIAKHFADEKYEDEYISTAAKARKSLEKHPWSLGGGGAAELKELLGERAEKALRDVARSVGISSFTLEDDVYLAPRGCWERLGVPKDLRRTMVIGEAVRDWSVGESPEAFFPYTSDFVAIEPTRSELRVLWPYRTNLANNLLFGSKTKIQGGLHWYEYGSVLRAPNESVEA